MFTRKRFPIPQLSGDWKVDGPQLLRVLNEYFLSLESKGALIIDPASLDDPELQAVASVTSAADKVPYFTGSGTAALADLSSAMRTFLTTSSSANLRGVLTDESGTGAAYFQGGDIGTPSAGVGTNLTGIPISTGVSGLGTNVATFLATPSNANLAAVLSDDTFTWTPAITFDTAGNLSVAYTTQVGVGLRVAKWTALFWTIQTSTFTHTTASGALRITGSPDTSLNTSNAFWVGSLQFQGITKATYTQFVPRMPANDTIMRVLASGSGVGTAQVQASDMPTGGTVVLVGSCIFQSA